MDHLTVFAEIMFIQVTKRSLLIFFLFPRRLKGLLDKEDQESEVIKDSPDSPEPPNKKPRVATEEVQPPERAKGANTYIV